MSNRFVVFEAFVNEADLTEMREVASFRVKGDALYFMTHNNLYPDDALELIELYEDGTLELIDLYGDDALDITLDDAQKKEMFNAITDAIGAHGLANIFDLSDYIEKHGAEIGIQSVDVMNDIIAPKTGLLRMYFDGAYQRRQQTNHNHPE